MAQGDNLKNLERLTEDVPVTERTRFYYTVVLELARETGVRKFFLAVNAARVKHGLSDKRRFKTIEARRLP